MRTPEIWVRSVRENVRNCRSQRQLSRNLSAEIDRCIRGCQNEMWHRTNVVNNSFNARLQQRTDDRVHLVDHLDEVSVFLLPQVAASAVSLATHSPWHHHLYSLCLYLCIYFNMYKTPVKSLHMLLLHMTTLVSFTNVTVVTNFT